MTLSQIALLAAIQGAAELLPVSSSAHVILAQKLMGLDPGSPQMTFLLVMLHTGTMFAVLAYFWKRWIQLVKGDAGRTFIKNVCIATVCTGVIGFGLKVLIEKIILEQVLGYPKGEVENLFRNLPLIGTSLLAVGIFIIAAGKRDQAHLENSSNLKTAASFRIGIVQGLCLPFRGFSRSGATISTGLYLGIPRILAEEFSFALAVVLTPPVILLELHRLKKAVSTIPYSELLGPGLIGMALSAASGFVALSLLSSWLEKGRWKLFGYYCLAASVLMFLAAALGL